MKSAALAVLDRSKHRGHDLWRDLRYFHRRLSYDEAPVLFDVGANIGQTATAMARIFPRACIFSFEPCRKTFEHLQRNVRKFRNVHAIQMGLGDKDEKRRIQLQNYSTTNSLLRPIEDEERTETIRIVTMEEFAKARQLKRIFLLKTDTEGFDENVLKGGAGLLHDKKLDYVLTEVCFFRKMSLPQTDFFRVSTLLNDFGYHICHFYEAVYASDAGTMLWCNALFTHL